MKLDQVADRKLNNFGDRKWRTTHSVEMYLFWSFFANVHLELLNRLRYSTYA